MNNNKLESKELYERIREYDEVISVPNSVRYSELNAYKSGIADIVKQVDELNSLPSNPKEKNIKLKRIYDRCMVVIAELIDENLKMKYDHRLEMKKKEDLIKKLNQFIDAKDDLDAELPSDDDSEEDSDEKELKKGLSRRELSMIKSLNK